MQALTLRVVAIYVDKVSQRWVVRDAEGQLWSLPSTNNPWEERQLFTPTAETDLEPIPGHYKYLLGIPI